jgi:hypothetical protein
VDANLVELLHFTIKFLQPQLDNAGISVRIIVENGDVMRYYKKCDEIDVSQKSIANLDFCR